MADKAWRVMVLKKFHTLGYFASSHPFGERDEKIEAAFVSEVNLTLQPGGS